MGTNLIVGKLVLMADVIAIIMLAICGRSFCHLITLILWQMEGHSGRCYDHLCKWMADVIAIAADGIAILVMANVIAIVADGIAT